MNADRRRTGEPCSQPRHATPRTITERLANGIEYCHRFAMRLRGNVADVNDDSIVWIIDELLMALREQRLVVPCEECGYPVPTPLTYDGEHLCSYHAPEPTVDDVDTSLEMEEQEDG